MSAIKREELRLLKKDKRKVLLFSYIAGLPFVLGMLATVGVYVAHPVLEPETDRYVIMGASIFVQLLLTIKLIAIGKKEIDLKSELGA